VDCTRQGGGCFPSRSFSRQKIDFNKAFFAPQRFSKHVHFENADKKTYSTTQ